MYKSSNSTCFCIILNESGSHSANVFGLTWLTTVKHENPLVYVQLFFTGWKYCLKSSDEHFELTDLLI